MITNVRNKSALISGTISLRDFHPSLRRIRIQKRAYKRPNVQMMAPSLEYEENKAVTHVRPKL